MVFLCNGRRVEFPRDNTLTGRGFLDFRYNGRPALAAQHLDKRPPVAGSSRKLSALPAQTAHFFLFRRDNGVEDRRHKGPICLRGKNALLYDPCDKILEQRLAHLRENGFRMELDALYGIFCVPHAHNDAVLGLARYFETVGTRLALDDEAVVARGNERIGNVRVDLLAVVVDLRHLAVHEIGSAHDDAAERRADGLMSQAHAEQRNFRTECCNDLHGNPRFGRRARPGRDNDCFGGKRADFVEGDPVVPRDAHLALVQFAEILHQIEGERIVIVDDQNHRRSVSSYDAFRVVDGGEKRAGLVHGLVEFEGRNRVGHDARAGLDVRRAAFAHHGADHNAGVEAARKVDVAERAAVDAAPYRFQFVNDLHGADLGGAGKRARREAGEQGVERVLAGHKSSGNVRHEVHDVRILLHVHHFLDPHAAVNAYATHVVSAEVDEHDVFGRLLRVLGEFVGEALVLCLGRAARTRPCNGPHFNHAVFNPHHHFRGRAGHLYAVQGEEIHVRRRVYGAQDAVDVERVCVHAHADPLRRHHLEHVACADVFLARLHRRFVLLPGEGRRRFLDVVHGHARRCEPNRKLVFEAAEPVARVPVRLLEGNAAVGLYGGDEQKLVLTIVKCDDVAVQAEEYLVDKIFLWAFVRDFLEQPHAVVGKVPHGAAAQPRQPFNTDRPVACKQRAEPCYGVAFALFCVLPRNFPRHAVAPERRKRPSADERVPRNLVAAGHAFEQEAVRFFVVKLEPDRDGRFGVGQYFMADRDNITLT